MARNPRKDKPGYLWQPGLIKAGNRSPVDSGGSRKPLPAELHYIYLDTNVFDQAWPQLSKEVKRIIAAARSRGILVYLPEVVLRELNRHWLEDVELGRAQFQQAHDQVRRLGLGTIDPPLLNSDTETNAAYVRKVADLLTSTGIKSIPLPSVSCDELLGFAIRQEVAFEDEGKNFQDSLIVLSVVDHMKTAPKSVGVLVSRDGVFKRKRPSLEALFREKNVDIHVASPEDLIKWFDTGKPPEGPESITEEIEPLTVLASHQAASAQWSAEHGERLLTLIPMSFYTDRSNPLTRRPIQYFVAGLPPEEQAWIGNLGNNRWKLLRVKGAQQGDWAGDYDSPEDALKALRAERRREILRSLNR